MKATLEQQRIRALHALAILDTPPEAELDELVELAAAICATPMSAITLIDSDRQWIKALTGAIPLEIPRETAFCNHLVRNNAALLVEDAANDDRFRQNPMVIGDPGVRFYAGVPVRSTEGLPLGALCVIDTEPRQISSQQQKALAVLAKQVAARMELRLQRRSMDAAMSELRQYQAELEEANARLQQLSFSDALTGVANRRAFEERLKVEFGKADRTQHSLALLMIDVDNFKRLNDLFGHGYGDEVLQRVAVSIARSTRMLDLPARYGGEEFAVLMPGASLGGAIAVAERIRRELQMEHWEERPVTVSIGIALVDPAMVDSMALVGSADLALYAAKETGKDRFTVYQGQGAPPLSGQANAATTSSTGRFH